MKKIKILHAHNHGHKNIGDDAMANNVYRKLSNITDNLWTISTYSPPENALLSKDVPSISKILNNYENPVCKVFLVLMAKLKLKALYAIYSYLVCESIFLIAKFYKAFGINIGLINNIKNLISSLSECEFYVRSGSGSLNDIWFWSSMYPQYTEARIAKLFGAKVFFLGQGIGPLSTNFRRKILGNFSDACELITLRDPDNSAKLLNASYAKNKNWIIVGDDAIDYPKEDVPLHVAEQLRNRKFVICQFRPTDYETKLGDEYWKKLGDSLNKILCKFDDITLVAISFSTGQINDLEPARKINKLLGKDVLEIIDFNFTPGQAKSLFSKAVFSIGQSYHFGVFSLAENTPFIGLYSNHYYHDKLTGLLDLYNASKNAIHFDVLHALPKLAEQLINDNAVIKRELEKINNKIIPEVNAVFSKFI